MRQHLKSCFERGKLDPFPKESDRYVTLEYDKIVTERLFCVCYMPFDEKRNMIKCNHCSVLYHLDCFQMLVAMLNGIVLLVLIT